MRPDLGEVLRPGHPACPGCAAALSLRLILKALGPRLAVVVVPSCVSIIAGPYPYSSIEAPVFHSAFAVAAPTAAGIANALKLQGRADVAVLALAGDGGTFDIGLQSLSGAADRNEDFIYVCMDNEGYMNTGVQVSSATPRFAWTGTTPTGNTRRKKAIMEIMAGHRIPYAATATPGFPEDLVAKVGRAREIRGTRFLHVLNPCPTGWKFGDEAAVRVSRAAVETNVFPLYEIFHGLEYRISYFPRSLAVEEYLSLQGRYRHLGESEIRAVQAETDRAWADLRARAERKGGGGAKNQAGG